MRVQDITDRADVGRATFYMHYRDKNELLKTVVERFYEEVMAQLSSMENPNDMTGLQNTLAHARQKPEFYRLVLNHPPTAQRMREVMAQRIRQRLSVFGKIPTKKLEMTTHFIAGAIVGLLHWWIDNPEQTSTEAVTQFTQQIMIGGVPSLLQG